MSTTTNNISLLISGDPSVKNLVIGYNQIQTTGTNNTYCGFGNNINNQVGSSMTCIGSSNLVSNLTGSNNTIIGVGNSNGSTAANNTICLGNGSFPLLTTGDANISIGKNGGGGLTTGHDNLFLGNYTFQSGVYDNSTCIGYGSVISGSNQVSLGSTNSNTYVPNTFSVDGLSTLASLNVSGLMTNIQSSDVLVSPTFSTNPSFSMLTGMVYYITPTSNSTTISFTDIPSTASQTYQFSIVLLTSSPYYLKSTTGLVNITTTDSVLYTPTLVGASNIVLPTTYTYLIQTFTILNISSTTTPSYKVLTSVSGY